MVEFTEINEEGSTSTSQQEQQEAPSASASAPASQERLLDAQEIESLISNNHVKRPSVKAHLESLVQKIRRDASALKRMEDSAARLEAEQEGANANANANANASNKEKEEEEETEEVIVEEVETKPAPAPTVASASASVSVSASTTATASATAIAPPQLQPSSSQKYKTIDKFLFDAGGYNSPTVSIYITSLPPHIYSLPKNQITCDFTPTSFDLKIHDHDHDPSNSRNNYRLLKDNLDKDVDVEKCKLVIKKNKIIIKLGKVKSEYGSYDSWMDLSSKKSKESKNRAKKDPSASIMDMMKEMYDSGDDNMKKMIGETMLKQREGKLGDDKLGGMGGMDDLNM